MAWIDNYLTGIDEIDLQHRELFELIVKFKNAIEDDIVDKEFFLNIAKFLLNYAMFHFNSEEEYMKHINYKGLVIHKNIHKHFSDKVIKIINGIKEEKTFNAMDLYTYLVQWLKNHIAVEDQKFSIAGGKLKSEKIKFFNEEHIINTVLSKLYQIDSMFKNNLINKVEYNFKKLQYIKTCFRSYRIDSLVNLKTLLRSISLLYEQDIIKKKDAYILKDLIMMDIDIDKKFKNDSNSKLRDDIKILVADIALTK